ncbi:hypothetical protein [Calothrix sp. 336/3]|uniref:hypothetical protein n=1 Tax=Calothrix sp. 336/3 TaxID=1337936 RepID=UPI0004E388EE|nr:hypothetical protein [Calothrix sp. 336/3]AKG23183.1 hypothetical protein IJ00_19590 [Calothrix sp. 336/3]
MTLTSNSFANCRTILGSSSLALLLLSLGASHALADINIQTTGTLSGTITLPSFNPNFNQGTTRVDTDDKGTYSRNGVPVYTSNYVKFKTNNDGSLSYYVDFKGIPVVSYDSILNSPVLADGKLSTFKYQGKLDVNLRGTVQDELTIDGLYTGIVTDPKTGLKYQGTFALRGEGPRYSKPNGGQSPTVFDFKSDIPGTPTVTSYKMTDSPLVKLKITVPSNTTPITTGGNTNNPPTTPTTPATPVIPTNPTTPTTPISSPSQPIQPIQPTAPVVSNSNSPIISPNGTVEFSSGQFVNVDNINTDPKILASAINLPKEQTKPKVRGKKIGPQSRVLLR